MLRVLTKGSFWYRLAFLLARALIAPDEVDQLLRMIDGGLTWADWQRRLARRGVLWVAGVGCVFFTVRARGYGVVFSLAVWSVRRSLERAIRV